MAFCASWWIEVAGEADLALSECFLTPELAEQVYDGPVDYAQDFMVWNVTD